MDFSQLSYEQKLDIAKTLLQQLYAMPFPMYEDMPDVNLLVRRDAMECITLAVENIETVQDVLSNE